MATNPLGPVDVEINAQKVVLQQLQIKFKAFTATFPNLPPKDRAKNIQEIQKSLESLGRFFDKLQGLNIQNTGTRFSAENLKQTYYILQAQWRKFETSLNSTQAG